MSYEIMADIVMSFHGFIVALVILMVIGSFFVKKLGIYTWILVLTIIINQVVFLGCPLVYLEQYFRKMHNPEVELYGSFTTHMFEKHLGIIFPSWAVNLVILAIFILLTYLMLSSQRKTNRKLALINLQDWLNEVVYIVGIFSFYPENWYELVMQRLEKNPVRTPAERFSDIHTGFKERILKFCKAEIRQLDPLVTAINQNPDPDQLRKLVRQAYEIIYVNNDIDNVLEKDF